MAGTPNPKWHQIRFTIEGDWTQATIRCPYDPADPDRPCRPWLTDTDEGGLDMASLECWPKTWLDNVDLADNEWIGNYTTPWVDVDCGYDEGLVITFPSVPVAVAVDPQPETVEGEVTLDDEGLVQIRPPGPPLHGAKDRLAAVDPSPPEPDRLPTFIENLDELAAMGQPVEPTRTPPLPSEPLAQQGKLLSGAEGPVCSQDAGSGPSITAVEPDPPTVSESTGAQIEAYDDGYQAAMTEVLAARTQVGWYQADVFKSLDEMPLSPKYGQSDKDPEGYGWLPVFIEGEGPIGVQQTDQWADESALD